MKNNVSTFFNAASAQAIDSSLRRYMLKVFTHMSAGLAVTAFVSFFLATTGAISSILFNRVFFIGLCVAEFAVVFYLSSRIDKLSVSSSKFWFYTYSVLNGATLTPLLAIFTSESLMTAFLASSAMFLSMVLFGYSTRKDLTSAGAFFFMGLIGLVIASFINLFFQSSGVSFVISIIGVAVFVGLTAWDSQMIKSMYFEGDSLEVSEKKAIIGALKLYLDFVNLFIYLLRLLGSRRD